jgi:hypothetical protein
VKVLWHVICKNKKESLFFGALSGEMENEVSNGFKVGNLAHLCGKFNA